MGIQVELMDDLTSYHPSLNKGTVGETTDGATPNDCYVRVNFHAARGFLTLWKSLKIVDQKYLEAIKIKQNKLFAALKATGKVEIHWTSRGGFDCLSYQYTLDGTKYKENNYFRLEAIEFVGNLRTDDIPFTHVGSPSRPNREAFKLSVG